MKERRLGCWDCRKLNSTIISLDFSDESDSTRQRKIYLRDIQKSFSTSKSWQSIVDWLPFGKHQVPLHQRWRLSPVAALDSTSLLGGGYAQHDSLISSIVLPTPSLERDGPYEYVCSRIAPWLSSFSPSRARNDSFSWNEQCSCRI